MCGILAILRQSSLDENTLKKLESLVDNRGPDYQSQLLNHETKCGLDLKLKASVLHLRGTSMQKQPVIDEHGHALMFNGHIYNFAGKSLDRTTSDTYYLADQLKQCKTSDDISQVISSIVGPFAFIYWCENLETLFYGRDFLGRRSLNAFIDDNHHPHVISSVSVHNLARKDLELNLKWVEVDCKGFYSLKFNNGKVIEKTRYAWNINSVYPFLDEGCKEDCDKDVVDISLSPLAIEPLNQDCRFPEEFSEKERESTMNKLETVLREAIEVRIQYNMNRCVQCRKTSQIETRSSCEHSKVAVAFSGGVDSALIALLVDKVYDEQETIDLINIAFKPNSPDRLSAGRGFKELRKLCPNRRWRLVLCDITSTRLQVERSNTIIHLLCPCNTVVDDSLGCACWFISEAYGRALDSTLDDQQFDAIFSTFLDYDITSADQPNSTKSFLSYNYRSPATILFGGMGIDEQLGGYSSHRAAWSSSKAEGVLKEISLQMRRIPFRNLGRDDRILADHARDVKLPYLDQNVISFLNSLPVGLKMNLNESLEVGPKKILRDLAHNLGLKESSKRIKRAMQFGTRIAHLENSKEKGNQVCERLKVKS